MLELKAEISAETPKTDPPSPGVAVNAISDVLGAAPPKSLRVQTWLYKEEPDNEKMDHTRNSGTAYQSSKVKRSASERTLFNKTWDNNKTLESWKKLLDNKSGDSSYTPPTSFTLRDDSYIKNSETDSTTSLISSGKKTNRVQPRVKYAMQQKSVIIFGANVIILCISVALVYLQDKAKFIASFANSPPYITISVIALASLLAINSTFCAIKQFRNAEEYQIQKGNANETLDKVLERQPRDKIIKSVRLEYSNGTHSNFALNAWEAKDNFINIGEKAISRTNKIESVINNRPLFTALLTGAVAANIVFPLGLLAIDGVNNVQKFYQNPFTHNIGLSLLIGSAILAFLIICLGIHYYRKTNCTNLIYFQEKINTESINKEFIKRIEQERTNALKDNHGKDAKCSSLTLEQVVVQSHNCKDTIYSIGG
ncbi:hypothetical protein [Wolbachia endosymbiont of Litomosoides brasiliensis]|uniref:hypothetical protein n=1 Tax=Wolbachia endosymbiont of Litomosoides brasiliensis TaxID=1812117 RepID=UPI00158D768C|nr:hypothetical protein [Wolbachia endosymbiont of Litomosoides brasiliensis]